MNNGLQSAECTHTLPSQQRPMESPSHSPTEWEAEGFDLGPFEYEEPPAISLFEDIDLWRYRCRACGEVRYYSEAAREHFELGKRTIVTTMIERRQARNL